jgi:tRNA (guanine37-N1)-methyltransferase
VKFSIITIFPDLLRNFLNYGLLEKAVHNGLLEVEVHDLRSFSRDKHRKVDDRPFSGGPGMVLMPDPLFRAVEHVRARHPAGGRVILFSAYGRVLDQQRVKWTNGRSTPWSTRRSRWGSTCSWAGRSRPRRCWRR